MSPIARSSTIFVSVDMSMWAHARWVHHCLAALGAHDCVVRRVIFLYCVFVFVLLFILRLCPRRGPFFCLPHCAAFGRARKILLSLGVRPLHAAGCRVFAANGTCPCWLVCRKLPCSVFLARNIQGHDAYGWAPSMSFKGHTRLCVASCPLAPLSATAFHQDLSVP